MGAGLLDNIPLCIYFEVKREGIFQRLQFKAVTPRIYFPHRPLLRSEIRLLYYTLDPPLSIPDNTPITVGLSICAVSTVAAAPGGG